MKSIIKKWFKNHFAFFKKTSGKLISSLVSYTDETNEKDKKRLSPPLLVDYSNS